MFYLLHTYTFKIKFMRRLLLLIICCLIGSGVALAQNRKVTGLVVDEGKEPLPGVTILVKGTNIGTSTGVDGRFELSAPQTATTLVAKYLGMSDFEATIQSGMMTITMIPSETALEEVVVSVAYGKAKKIALTGAVASVDAKAIEQRPVLSATSVLEGVLGVQVNSTYGQPGSSPDIRIRGFTTINGTNAPLYVLDGVTFSGNIADINPQDIESISVLKDAASAALYGSRASNGVILITTKKGKNETVRIRLNMNQGVFERGITEYDRINADQFMESMWMGYRNNLMSTLPKDYPTKEAANAKASASLVSDILKYNIYNKPSNQLFDADGNLVADASILNGYQDDLNWYKPMERKGYSQDYSISGDASSSKGSYFFSAGYSNTEGYFKNSGFERFTGRTKIDLTPKKWFNTGLALSGSYQISDRSNAGSSNTSSYTNPFSFARNIAPIYPVHLHNMETGDYTLDDSGNKIYDSGSLYGRPQDLARHVIWENELNLDRTYRNTLDGSLYADVMFLKDFKFTVKGNLNVRNQEQRMYDNAIIGDGAGNNGRAGRTSYGYKEYTFQEQLNWGRIFNEKHQVDVFASHENYSWERVYTSLRKTNEIFPGKTDLVNFTVNSSTDGYTDNYRLESYLLRGRYNYNEKYFADASFRRDGSSRFHPDNRWGNFWSAGANWVITQEDFMLGMKDQINFMKLRASYGEVGNDQSVDYYGYMALYNVEQNANQGALYKSQNEASDIKWEGATSLGIALEGRLFNRIDFSAEYFDKRSTDLLFDVNLPLSAGGTSTNPAASYQTKNIGSVSNKGIEFGVNVDILKSKIWKWSVGADITAFKNEILKLPEENRKDGIINGTKRYLEGHGIYDFWMYQYVGVDQMTGNALYQPNLTNYYIGDTPEAGKTKLPADYVVSIGGQYYTTNAVYSQKDWSGSAIPDMTGSFNTALGWKNFNLSVLFTYGLGGKTLDSSYQSLMSMSGTPGSLHSDVLNSWKDVPAGMTLDSPNRIDKNGTPVIDFSRSQYTNATTSRFLKDASYLVLKNINLSYAFPKSTLKKVDLSSVTLNCTIENLVTLTSLKGMNPQQAYSGISDNMMVTPRVFSMGLSVQF